MFYCSSKHKKVFCESQTRQLQVFSACSANNISVYTVRSSYYGGDVCTRGTTEIDLIWRRKGPSTPSAQTDSPLMLESPEAVGQTGSAPVSQHACW